MSAEVSFTKRAAAELSRCFNGINVRQNKNKSATAANVGATAEGHSAQANRPKTAGDHQKPLITESTQLISNQRNGGKQLSNNSYNKSLNQSNNQQKVANDSAKTPNGTPRRGSRTGLPPPQAPPKTSRARRKNYLLSLQKAKYVDELWTEPKFLLRLFAYFSPLDRCLLAQVCHASGHSRYRAGS